MKKIIYLLAITLVFFASCNPMDDVYNELDQLPSANDKIVGDVTFTLTDDDYEELDLNYGNFGSTDQAKNLIPGLLTSKYPTWGVTYDDETGKIKKASSAIVTYELYAPKQEQDSIVRYTVTTEDYDSNPETARFDNFNDDDQIFDLLAFKYPTPVDNMLVSLTYKFYNGNNVEDLNNGFFYTDGEWKFITGITNDEYALLGERFPNFSSEDEAEEKMPVLLLEKFKYDFYEAGDIVPTMYKLYVTDVSDLDGDGRTNDRTTYSYIKYFVFDGAAWSAYTNVVSETTQFGHDGTTWVPDNTIKLTIGSTEIAIIESLLGANYPDQTANVARFGSFDIRTSSGNYWSPTMLLEAFNALLDNINPNAEDGQKYVLTIVTYDGSIGEQTFSLIKDSANPTDEGHWILN